MDRRRFLLTSLAGALAAPIPARAQPAGKVHRIGVLEVAGSASSTNLEAFRQGLRDLGYVEGQNVVIEYRSADDRAERGPDLAAELVRLRMDVIVTSGDAAVVAASQVTRTTPIVMASTTDPVGLGVATSLARPGGNVTGFHFWAPASVGGQRLRLLQEIVPRLLRVAVLWNPGNLYHHMVDKATKLAASALGVQLHSLSVQREWELERAFEAALLAQVDGLIAVEDYLTITDRARIVDFAAMSRLPAIYGLREFVDAGGLVAYGTDRRDLYRRAAAYVHRILTGASPADLPVESPTKVELVINRKTAGALGLTLPPSLLARADQIIE